MRLGGFYMHMCQGLADSVLSYSQVFSFCQGHRYGVNLFDRVKTWWKYRRVRAWCLG